MGARQGCYGSTGNKEKLSLNCLYFSYDGLLDPLGQSQVLPYIKRLNEAGHTFTIISYEKNTRTCKELVALKNSLKILGINWIRLSFGVGKLSFLKRIIIGIIAIRRACAERKFELVHLRGLQAAVIYMLTRVEVPHLYDIRAFFWEWVDIDRVSKGSYIHNILEKLDRSAVETAVGLVILEKTGLPLLHSLYNTDDIPVRAIRTCTDISRYPDSNVSQNYKSGSIKFIFLGGAKLPYRPHYCLICRARKIGQNHLLLLWSL